LVTPGNPNQKPINKEDDAELKATKAKSKILQDLLADKKKQ